MLAAIPLLTETNCLLRWHRGYCVVLLGGAPQRVFPLLSPVRDLPLSHNLHKTQRHLKSTFAFPHEKSAEPSSTFSSQHYHAPALKLTSQTKTYGVYLNVLNMKVLFQNSACDYENNELILRDRCFMNCKMKTDGLLEVSHDGRFYC